MGKHLKEHRMSEERKTGLDVSYELKAFRPFQEKDEVSKWFLAHGRRLKAEDGTIFTCYNDAFPKLVLRKVGDWDPPKVGYSPQEMLGKYFSLTGVPFGEEVVDFSSPKKEKEKVEEEEMPKEEGMIDIAEMLGYNKPNPAIDKLNELWGSGGLMEKLLKSKQDRESSTPGIDLLGLHKPPMSFAEFCKKLGLDDTLNRVLNPQKDEGDMDDPTHGVKHGEWALFRDTYETSEDSWVPRIFLGHFPNACSPFICVEGGEDGLFAKGEVYNLDHFDEMKPLSDVEGLGQTFDSSVQDIREKFLANFKTTGTWSEYSNHHLLCLLEDQLKEYGELFLKDYEEAMVCSAEIAQIAIVMYSNAKERLSKNG